MISIGAVSPDTSTLPVPAQADGTSASIAVEPSKNERRLIIGIIPRGVPAQANALLRERPMASARQGIMAIYGPPID